MKHGYDDNVITRFDVEQYLDLNPDVKAAGFTTPKLAIQHYLNHGKNEGRLYLKQPPVIKREVSFENAKMKVKVMVKKH